MRGCFGVNSVTSHLLARDLPRPYLDQEKPCGSDIRGSAIRGSGLCPRAPLAEPWPDVARSQERETKAKRMRPPGINDQRSPLSRGPSGLPRSGKSGKMALREYVTIRSLS